jgi:hypothetical protein
MGRRERERIARIKAGLESPIAKTVVKVASRSEVVSTLQNAELGDQIDALNSTVARDKPNKLRDAIIRKAPGEMDKGIKRLQKEGREVNVDALCAEIKSTPGFLAMCRGVGLDLEWFEELARKRMDVFGITVNR